MNNSANSFSRILRRTVRLGAVLIGLALPTALSAQGYRSTLLVSDITNLALHTDTNLINAWGLAIEDNGTLVVCATESSLTGFYRPDGRRVGDYIEVDEEPTGVQINRRADAQTEKCVAARSLKRPCDELSDEVRRYPIIRAVFCPELPARIPRHALRLNLNSGELQSHQPKLSGPVSCSPAP